MTDQIREIVELQLQALNTRLRDRNITLAVSEKAIDHFAEAGYDLVFGARPLKRLMQNTLLNELSQEIIAGTIKEGEKIKVDWDDKLKFSKTKIPAFSQE
jgi:ATP-dependent Clp protease ATP-binding subunit ClpB